jgi:RNase H-like domain found in reverse transcriptase
LEEVLRRLARHQLKVHADKSKFWGFEMEFLGFTLCHESIRTQEKKVEAMQALQMPKKVKQVHSILGLVNCYKQFIPHHSGLLAPLTALTRKNKKFVWSTECKCSLATVKKTLSKNITLTILDFKKPFDIYTDANKVQLGAVIEHEGKPLAFYSRKLSDAQPHYTVMELELLSIVETLQEYFMILLGHIVKVYMDHKNLTFDNFTTDHVCRWRLIVEEYGPKTIDIKGCTNVVANKLSR